MVGNFSEGFWDIFENEHVVVWSDAGLKPAVKAVIMMQLSVTRLSSIQSHKRLHCSTDVTSCESVVNRSVQLEGGFDFTLENVVKAAGRGLTNCLPFT